MTHTFYTNKLRMKVHEAYQKYASSFTYTVRIYQNRNEKTPIKIKSGIFNEAWETTPEQIPTENGFAAITTTIYYDIYYKEKCLRYNIIGCVVGIGQSQKAKCVELSLNMTRAVTEQLNDTIKKQHITRRCRHKEGAVKVAEYIVAEIKKNVKSEKAQSIRCFIDSEEIRKQQEEWLSRREQIGEYPEKAPLHASILFALQVAPNRPWDHKPMILKNYKDVASTPRYKGGEGHFHNYETHDYNHDVWSNIHFGYIGLSVGFSESYLLFGADVAQGIHDGWKKMLEQGWKNIISLKEVVEAAFVGDSIDDQTSTKIGFALYKKFGKYAEKLTAQDVLDELEATPYQLMPVSKTMHLCSSLPQVLTGKCLA